MDNQFVNNPNWEKVLAKLNEEQKQEDLNLTVEEEALLTELQEIKATAELYDDTRFFDTNEKWKELLTQIAPRTHKLWTRISVAVAAVAAVVFGVWFYRSEVSPQRSASRNDNVVMNDILPGRNTATLTLANGKTIQLSDTKTGVVINDELKYNDGTEVALKSSNNESSNPPLSDHNSASVEMLTATTPRGGTYQIMLPDGTKVWLNADSKLEFPSKFIKNKQRIVSLSGEAYFEVTKNRSMPFRVISGMQIIEVLGTHFNVNAYPEEDHIRTTLLEGSVKVLNKGDQALLRPGEQSAISAVSGININEVNTEEVVAWKNGWFAFNEADIKTVMRQISRWYDVNVEFQGAIPADHFKGRVSRNEKLSQVLKIIELSGVNFKIEGRKIIVK